MLAARFIAKGIGDVVEIEAAIDDWLDLSSVDCSHEIHLMPAAADDQALEPCLFCHQLSGRDFAGAASQDTDQSEPATAAMD